MTVISFPGPGRRWPLPRGRSLARIAESVHQ